VMRENKQFGSEIDDFGIGSVDLGSACASPLLPRRGESSIVANEILLAKRESGSFLTQGTGYHIRKRPAHKDTLKLTALDESWRKQDTSSLTNNANAVPTKVPDVGKLNSDISVELLASVCSNVKNR